jgi:hypothetical protein
MAEGCSDDLGPLAPLIEKGKTPVRLIRSCSGALWFLPERASDVPGARQVFAPRGLFLHLRWMAWQVGLPMSERARLNSGFLEEIARTTADDLEPTGFVIYVGTPGAYRKATLGWWASERACAIVKLGLTSAANDAVRWEATVLERLGKSTELADMIPTLLRTGTWRNLFFHVTAPVVGEYGPAHLSPEHFAFCERLFSIDRQKEPWRESCLVNEWINDLSTMDGFGFTTPLLRGMEWLVNRLFDHELSFGWAHRDFTPWNVRRIGHQMMVLDWEAARPCRPPGYDLVHFVSIRAALRGLRHRVPWGALQSWLSLVAPEWGGLVRELYASYLVDQALFYGKARILAPQMGDDRVLRWLIRELECLLEDAL